MDIIPPFEWKDLKVGAQICQYSINLKDKNLIIINYYLILQYKIIWYFIKLILGRHK